VPQQTSEWAPYRDGSWVWEGGYGWTWVGDEPWGWAPYHYGRWFWANGYGWAWLPPAYAYDPTWYPALVGFYGYGDGLSVDFGFPCIGWVPLAPFEPFYAWYPGWAWGGYGWGYRPGWGGWGNRIVSITNIRNIYRNFGHGGGSGTLRGKFGQGKLGHNAPVTSRNVGRVGQLRAPVAPTRASLGFGRAPSTRVAFSHEFQSPRFASSLGARGDAFAEQQHAIPSAAAHSSVPATSWNRFNSERGSVTPSYSERGSSSTHEPYGASTSRGETYTRTTSGSSYEYTRNPSQSESRTSYPSYSHSASYPSYSHGASYPSYSHGASYPSYSRPQGGQSYSHPPAPPEGSAPHGSSNSGGSSHGGHPPV
jgi:hypothetical protein